MGCSTPPPTADVDTTTDNQVQEKTQGESKPPPAAEMAVKAQVQEKTQGESKLSNGSPKNISLGESDDIPILTISDLEQIGFQKKSQLSNDNILEFGTVIEGWEGSLQMDNEIVPFLEITVYSDKLDLEGVDLFFWEEVTFAISNVLVMADEPEKVSNYLMNQLETTLSGLGRKNPLSTVIPTASPTAIPTATPNPEFKNPLSPKGLMEDINTTQNIHASRAKYLGQTLTFINKIGYIGENGFSLEWEGQDFSYERISCFGLGVPELVNLRAGDMVTVTGLVAHLEGPGDISINLQPCEIVNHQSPTPTVIPTVIPNPESENSLSLKGLMEDIYTTQNIFESRLKYMGQTFTFTGQIGFIGEGAFSFDWEGRNPEEVFACFTSDTSELAKLRLGNTVTVTGSIAGLDGPDDFFLALDPCVPD